MDLHQALNRHVYNFVVLGAVKTFVVSGPAKVLPVESVVMLQQVWVKLLHRSKKRSVIVPRPQPIHFFVHRICYHIKVLAPIE